METKVPAKPWLPRKLREIHKACSIFQSRMVEVYEDEKRLLVEGKQPDRNFMTTLVRASQKQTGDSKLKGLTESEIYGNIFTFNFVSHDTTTHTFTIALYFLAANPDVQDWVSEEIRFVMGSRSSDEWLYSDSPRLKQCLAVMYETLHLYTPVPTSKVGDGQLPQSLVIGNKTIVLSPKTMIVLSYASIQTDPKYWGDDSLTSRPSRFVKSPERRKAAHSTLDDEAFLVPERGTFLSWSGGARDCVGKKIFSSRIRHGSGVAFSRLESRPGSG